MLADGGTNLQREIHTPCGVYIPFRWEYTPCVHDTYPLWGVLTLSGATFSQLFERAALSRHTHCEGYLPSVWGTYPLWGVPTLCEGYLPSVRGTYPQWSHVLAAARASGVESPWRRVIAVGDGWGGAGAVVAVDDALRQRVHWTQRHTVRNRITITIRTIFSGKGP